jgi:type I restriction enzyme S subunit
MTDLPNGWDKKKMGAIGRYLNGKAFKSQDWRTSGRPIIRIQNLTGSGDEYNYFQGEIEERYVVKPGDLLFSWSATLGTYIWQGPEAVLNQHIFKVESLIDKRFHRYLLDFKIQEMLSKTHGSGMVHITKKSFDEIEVNIPPLPEQQKIVELLEDHLSRLDAALADVKQAKLKAAQFRRSLLQAVFTGNLNGGGTRLMMPVTEWKKTKLVKVVDAAWGDTSKTKSSYVEAGFTAFSASGPDGFLDYFDYDQEGIVLSAIGANCGKVYFASGRWSCIKNTMRFLVKDEEELSVKFLFYALSNPNAFVRRGSGQPFIRQQDVRDMEISYPPLPEQQKIVEILEDHLSRLETSVAIADAMEKQSASLRRSLLQAAFTGKLTKEVASV